MPRKRNQKFQKQTETGMKRFKVFTVILAVTIGLATLPGIIQDFMFGWSLGSSQVERHTCDALQIPLRADRGDIFTTSEEIRLNGIPAQVSLGKIDIAIPESFLAKHHDTKAVRSFIASETAMTIVSLVALVAIVYIAIEIIRVLYSVLRTRLFEKQNLRRISLIGWLLLALELSFAVVRWWQLHALCGFVHFENHHINFMEIFNAYGIIMAIIILLMNELLRLAVNMKEEQDLTI